VHLNDGGGDADAFLEVAEYKVRQVRVLPRPLLLHLRTRARTFCILMGHDSFANVTGPCA